jgi:hypothetical protein
MTQALLMSMDVLTLEGDLDLDALVELLANLDHLRTLLELAWVRNLRLISLVSLDQP